MKLKYTPEAIADLQGIKHYISGVLHNAKAADRIIKSILDSCTRLEDFPQLGAALCEKENIDTDLRYLLCEKYIALYRVEEDVIMVARILDGRTDYLRILFKA